MEDSRDHWPEVSEAPPIRSRTLHAYDAPRFCGASRNVNPGEARPTIKTSDLGAFSSLRRPTGPGILGKLLHWLWG